MEKQLQYFNRLTSDAVEYLSSVHGFSIRTIGHYKGGWRIIKEYMIAKKIRRYNPSIGKKVLHTRFNKRGIRDLSRSEKMIYNSVVRLSEYQAYGKIDLQPLMERKFFFSGPLGKAITTFITHKEINDRLSLTRIWGYQRHLHTFFKYCKSQDVCSLSNPLPPKLTFLKEVIFRSLKTIKFKCEHCFQIHTWTAADGLFLNEGTPTT